MTLVASLLLALCLGFSNTDRKLSTGDFFDCVEGLEDAIIYYTERVKEYLIVR